MNSNLNGGNVTTTFVRLPRPIICPGRMYPLNDLTMRKKEMTSRLAPAKKVYHKPALAKLGSVQQLTLKIGSISDGMGSHQ